MLYDTFPNTSSVTTCVFPIPTDIIEDVPLCAGHSADTACSDCYTCRRTIGGEGARLYRRARFAVYQVESNENPQKEAMQNRHPTVCSWWHSKSSAHVLCVCGGQIWQYAAKCQSSAEHFCTSLDAKESLRFPLDTLTTGKASGPLTFSATL